MVQVVESPGGDGVRIGVGTGVLHEQLLQRVGLAFVHRDDDLVAVTPGEVCAAVASVASHGCDARVRVRDRDLHSSGLGVTRLGPVVVVDVCPPLGLRVGRRTILGAHVIATAGGLDVVVVVTTTADEHDDADDHDDDQRWVRSASGIRPAPPLT